MKTQQDKNYVLWLIVLIVVVAAIAIYRVGFHRPVPAFDFDEGAITPLEGPQVQTQPIEKPSATSPGPVLQPPQTADLKPEQVKDRQFRSERPLYFRAVFGEEGDHSTLCVLDESGGTGKGYDVVYVDENRNGDLTDDPAKQCAKYERGPRAGQINPTFNFIGPLKDRASVRYSLTISSLRQGRHAGSGDQYYVWTLDADDWNYLFINGKMRLSSSAADALTGPPVRLAGSCKWQISVRIRDGKPMISAGLKDENGCTLRIIRKGGKTISPKLTLIQDGQVKAEKTMTFG